MLDLQQLRYFVAVADGEHVGRAAAQLHISQSPLSRRIQQLEASLGLALFERSRKRLRLTAAGREFLADARALIVSAARVEARARERAEGSAGTLVIGYVEGAVHAGVLPAALRAFRQQVPDARIELRAMRSTDQFAALLDHRIDLGFAYRAAQASAGLLAHPLVDEPFVLCVPAASPWAAGRITGRRLDGAPFIAFPEALSPQTRADFLAACARAGFTPDIRFEATEPSVVLELVAAGLGCAAVQHSLRSRRLAGVRFRELPARFDARLRIFRLAHREPSPLAARFIAA